MLHLGKTFCSRSLAVLISLLGALDPAPEHHQLEGKLTHLTPKSGFQEETEIRYWSIKFLTFLGPLVELVWF